MIPHFHSCIGLDIVEPLLGYQIRTSILCLKKYCFTHHSSWKMWVWGLLHNWPLWANNFQKRRWLGSIFHPCYRRWFYKSCHVPQRPLEAIYFMFSSPSLKEDFQIAPNNGVHQGVYSTPNTSLWWLQM
jgi:hypothetical protein